MKGMRKKEMESDGEEGLWWSRGSLIRKGTFVSMYIAKPTLEITWNFFFFSFNIIF